MKNNRKRNYFCGLLAFLMLLGLCVPFGAVTAAEAGTDWEPSYRVNASPDALTPGVTTTVTVSIDNCGAAPEEIGINGFQIDVKGLDSTLFQVENIQPLVTTGTPFVNKGNYIEADGVLKFLFMDLSNVLERTQKKLMQFEITPLAGVTQEQLEAVKLDLIYRTTLVGTSDNKRTSYGTYEFGSGTDVEELEITFGSLEFTYTDGAWDPEKHRYDTGTWRCVEGADEITVTGSSGTAALSYTSAGNCGVTGSFVNEEGTPVTGIAAGTSARVKLSGTPQGLGTEFTAIGSVTVTVIAE